jgi:hypothetical protein
MRYILFIFSSMLLTSCFVFDKLPEVEVKIDKSLVQEIDSIFLEEGAYFETIRDVNRKGINKANQKYSFFPYDQNFRIKLLLKNSQEIVSSTFNKRFTTIIRISRDKEKIQFIQVKETKLKKYGLVIFIIILTVIIIKVPIALLVISPSDKLTFIRDYGGINMVYLTLFILLIAIFSDKFIIFLYPYYFVIIIADILFLTSFYNDKGVKRPIIAAVLSNILFLTIGQFVITFAIMMST